MNTKPSVPPEKRRLAALLLSVKDQYDWSQARLAREIGTNTNSISKWMKADDLTMPSAPNLALIVRVVALLPASNPNSWIKTLDDLDVYLKGSDRAPAIALVEAMRFVSNCDDLQDLFDLMLASMSRGKILIASLPATGSRQEIRQPTQ